MYQNPAPLFLTVTLRFNSCQHPVLRAVLSRMALFLNRNLRADILNYTSLSALISTPRLKV